PSPSSWRWAVTTPATGRHRVSCSGSGWRRGRVRVSAVTAGIRALLGVVVAYATIIARDGRDPIVRQCSGAPGGREPGGGIEQDAVPGLVPGEELAQRAERALAGRLVRLAEEAVAEAAARPERERLAGGCAEAHGLVDRAHRDVAEARGGEQRPHLLGVREPERARAAVR